MKKHPIEIDLTQKIVYLATQLTKQNSWYGKYDYMLSKDKVYTKKERTRAEMKRDECEKSIREYIDKLFEALSISENQFLESIETP